MSATVQSSAADPIGMLPDMNEVPTEQAEAAGDRVPALTQQFTERERARRRRAYSTRETRLSEESPATLLGHIARLEASMGAALSLLRRCIVEHETPTREALAAEAGFALGMSREAALAELDDVAQIVGVSSLR